MPRHLTSPPGPQLRRRLEAGAAAAQAAVRLATAVTSAIRSTTTRWRGARPPATRLSWGCSILKTMFRSVLDAHSSSSNQTRSTYPPLPIGITSTISLVAGSTRPMPLDTPTHTDPPPTATPVPGTSATPRSDPLARGDDGVRRGVDPQEAPVVVPDPHRALAAGQVDRAPAGIDPSR